MPPTAQKSVQLTAFYASGAKIAAPDGGGSPLRGYPFTANQVGAGTATSTVDLVFIPAGRVRIYTFLSTIQVAPIAGAGATAKIGYLPYYDQNGVLVVADDDALSLVPIDVATTTIKQLNVASGASLLLDSRDGIIIQAAFTAIADLVVTSGIIVASHQ